MANRFNQYAEAIESTFIRETSGLYLFEPILEVAAERMRTRQLIRQVDAVSRAKKATVKCLHGDNDGKH
jgi:hypothetical protein